MPEDYPWYERLDENEDVLQGDLFRGFPIPRLPDDLQRYIDEKANPPVQIELYDVIVLSQSCDLANKKLPYVLLAPHVTFTEFHQHPSFKSFKAKDVFERLKQGAIPSAHALNAIEIPGLEDSIRVVTFSHLFTVPVGQVVEAARRQSPRVRLRPPYREYIAQGFARYMMRVGLPIDLVYREK